MWICRCDCGTVRVVAANALVRGMSRSCGCFRVELLKATRPYFPPSNRTHGLSRVAVKEYRAWVSMRARCGRQSHPTYPHYGGRGIAVCERWKASFRSFYDDIGPAPSPAHSLERINNDGCYEPGNVRWATREEQTANTRRTHRITFNGTTLPLKRWARKIGMSGEGLHNRLRRGWSVERALTTPVISRRIREVKPDDAD